MINQENLNKLYNAVINGSELTTKELNSYGFNSKDLADLIQQGTLKRIKRGYYAFQCVSDLYYYGKKLIAEKEYEEAFKCFNVCYELNPNDYGVCSQLFTKSLSLKDYENVFKYFDVLAHADNLYRQTDVNFYLYLLSVITDVPDKYKEYARNLNLEDISIDFSDIRYKDINQQNKVRQFVFKRRFAQALAQLNEIIDKQKSLTEQDVIARLLLYQAIDVEVNNKKILLDFVKSKSYSKIAKYLEEKQNQYNLSPIDNYILKLVNQIMEIQETHRVPEKTIFKSNELFKAIDGNNYQLALDINERFNRRKNINNSENIINLLLTDICVLINQYSQETQKPIDFTKDGSAISREDKLEEESMLVTTNLSLSALFSNVVAFLIKGDLVNAFRTLRVYLESIDKKDYEFLIVDLIKISLIEGDVGFTKPLITLTCINKENFEFDTPHYIQEFYIALSKNRFDEARIYLDIVAQSNKLRQDYNLTDVLLQILNSVERTIDYKRNTKVLDDVQNAFEKSQNLNFEKTKNSSVKLTKLTSQVKSPNLEITSKSVTNNICHPVKVDSEKEFIERNHEILLQDKGAILLKPMSSERIKRITEIVKKYSDMVCFTVGDDENCQIVLRYKPNNDDDIDLETLIKEGNSAYEACDYNGCIRNYLQLLQGENPSSAIYGKLGLAYMLKYDKKRAINYLTIATKLSKQRGGKRDFTKLICSLKGLPYIGNIKPSFYMKVKDFEKNTHGYYGIGNLDEITSYILQSGLGVESACNELGMTDNEIDKILLVYAREFYLQGDLKKGDEFLNAVEKRKNKTKNVIKYIAEVRNRKKFYVNRDNENPLKLCLRLQPK